jgi:hypothetical protein
MAEIIQFPAKTQRSEAGRARRDRHHYERLEYHSTRRKACYEQQPATLGSVSLALYHALWERYHLDKVRR